MTENIPPTSEPNETSQEETGQEVNLRLLAEEIMKLLKEELRLNLERQGRGH